MSVSGKLDIQNTVNGYVSTQGKFSEIVTQYLTENLPLIVNQTESHSNNIKKYLLENEKIQFRRKIIFSLFSSILFRREEKLKNISEEFEKKKSLFNITDQHVYSRLFEKSTEYFKKSAEVDSFRSKVFQNYSKRSTSGLQELIESYHRSIAFQQDKSIQEMILQTQKLIPELELEKILIQAAQNDNPTDQYAEEIKMHLLSHFSNPAYSNLKPHFLFLKKILEYEDFFFRRNYGASARLFKRKIQDKVKKYKKQLELSIEEQDIRLYQTTRDKIELFEELETNPDLQSRLQRCEEYFEKLKNIKSVLNQAILSKKKDLLQKGLDLSEQFRKPLYELRTQASDLLIEIRLEKNFVTSFHSEDKYALNHSLNQIKESKFDKRLHYLVSLGETQLEKMKKKEEEEELLSQRKKEKEEEEEKLLLGGGLAGGGQGGPGLPMKLYKLYQHRKKPILHLPSYKNKMLPHPIIKEIQFHVTFVERLYCVQNYMVDDPLNEHFITILHLIYTLFNTNFLGSNVMIDIFPELLIRIKKQRGYDAYISELGLEQDSYSIWMFCFFYVFTKNELAKCLRQKLGEKANNRKSMRRLYLSASKSKTSSSCLLLDSYIEQDFHAVLEVFEKLKVSRFQYSLDQKIQEGGIDEFKGIVQELIKDHYISQEKVSQQNRRKARASSNSTNREDPTSSFHHQEEEEESEVNSILKKLEICLGCVKFSEPTRKKEVSVTQYLTKTLLWILKKDFKTFKVVGKYHFFDFLRMSIGISSGSDELKRILKSIETSSKARHHHSRSSERLNDSKFASFVLMTVNRHSLTPLLKMCFENEFLMNKFYVSASGVDRCVLLTNEKYRLRLLEMIRGFETEKVIQRNRRRMKRSYSQGELFM